MDCEHGTDVLNEVLNNSTDSNPQLGSDGATGGSSVETMSHPEGAAGGSSVETMSYPEQKESPMNEPYVGQEFESEAAALEFYCTYATRLGFATRMRDHNCSQRDGSIISRTLVCNKEGYRRTSNRPQMPHSRKPRAVTRVGCKARVSFRKQSTGTWVIRSLVKDHTHPLALNGGLAPKAKNPRFYQILVSLSLLLFFSLLHDSFCLRDALLVDMMPGTFPINSFFCVTPYTYRLWIIQIWMLKVCQSLFPFKI